MSTRSQPAGGRGSIHTRRLQDHLQRLLDRADRSQLTPADLRDQQALPWYTITNQADEQQATVYVYDEVGGSLGVSAEQFATDLDEITAPEIAVRINSPGGALFDGIAIYNSLASHRARVVTYVDSLAASIASIIAMAGDEIVMQPGSQMMIHDALAMEIGNAGDMRAMATFLDRQSDNLADIYRMHAGGQTSQWRDRMLAETWLFGPEAVALGLADRVASRGDDDPDDDGGSDDAGDQLGEEEIAALMTRAHSLARYRYPGRAHAPSPASAPAASRRPAPRPATRKPDVAAVRDAIEGAFR